MILPGSYANGFAPRDGEPLYPELWRGCAGAWAPCLGPTGVTLRDWSGYGNHGVLTGMDPGTDWVVNGGRYALDFDGSNDHVPIAIRLENSFTISVWIKSNGNTGKFIWESQTLSAPSLEGSDSGYAFYMLDGSYKSISTGAITVGQSYNIVATYDTGENTQKLYVGGELKGTNTVNTDNLITTLYIASRLGSIGNFNGTMDDIRVYRRALLPREIRLLASRRGIAYELAPIRYSGESAGFLAAWRRQQSFIIGGGLQ